MIDNTMELTHEQSRILLVRELMMRVPYGVKLEHKPSGVIINITHIIIAEDINITNIIFYKTIRQQNNDIFFDSVQEKIINFNEKL